MKQEHQGNVAIISEERTSENIAIDYFTNKRLKNIDKQGWYWAQGSVVMANFGDTHTFTFCMCRNHKEAKTVAMGLNLLDHLKSY